MRNLWKLIVIAVVLGACSKDHSRPEIRKALDQARMSLRDSVGFALEQAGATTAVKARLVMSGKPVFSIGALDQRNLRDVRIDLASGQVVSMTAAGTASGPCPGSISIAEALAIAERAADGDGVAVVPDDDVACAREIQILSGDTLIEVKVAGDGAILEQELSDEYGGSGEDD